MKIKQSEESSGLRWKSVLGFMVFATLCATQSSLANAQGRDEGSSVRVLAEIDDAQLGTRWLLRSDPAHPGGPGVMMLSFYAKKPHSNASFSLVAAHPVIRGGDRLIVEERSPVVEARLEAIALGSATAGSSFRARLKIGGKIVRAIALGSGLASLVPESEALR